ncbi:hypothetical protein A2U01_0056069, partial [Trifolium medium]|nr:hypothetical protein [Trifolium medium]
KFSLGCHRISGRLVAEHCVTVSCLVAASPSAVPLRFRPLVLCNSDRYSSALPTAAPTVTVNLKR